MYDFLRSSPILLFYCIDTRRKTVYILKSLIVFNLIIIRIYKVIIYKEYKSMFML